MGCVFIIESRAVFSVQAKILRESTVFGLGRVPSVAFELT